MPFSFRCRIFPPRRFSNCSIRRHFSLTGDAILPRPDKIYSCCEGKPILHDTVIEIVTERISSTSYSRSWDFGLETDCEPQYQIQVIVDRYVVRMTVDRVPTSAVSIFTGFRFRGGTAESVAIARTIQATARDGGQPDCQQLSVDGTGRGSSGEAIGGHTGGSRRIDNGSLDAQPGSGSQGQNAQHQPDRNDQQAEESHPEADVSERCWAVTVNFVPVAIPWQT